MFRLALILLAATVPGAAWAQTAEVVEAGKTAVAALQAQGVPGYIAVIFLILAGLVVAACVVVMKVLRAEIKARDDAIAERDKAIQVIQDKRVSEAAEFGRSQARTTAEASSTVATLQTSLADIRSMTQASLNLGQGVQQALTTVGTQLDRNFTRIDTIPAAIERAIDKVSDRGGRG